MNYTIQGAPAFGFVHIDLAPGESIITESDAMTSMHAELDMQPKLNGGLLKGLIRKFLGGESLFINTYTNNTQGTLRLTLTQTFPGDVKLLEIKAGEKMYLQSGAFICSEPGVKMGLEWAGFNSWIGGEGLFRLSMSGEGKFMIGAYGGLVEKEINGELIVDTDHLVAYPKGFKIKTQLSGNIISSITSGEGFVMRITGQGKVILQTRSFSGLAKWINRNL
jgi:uncharacterized protein (TIGR00266 family)